MKTTITPPSIYGSSLGAIAWGAGYTAQIVLRHIAPMLPATIPPAVGQSASNAPVHSIVFGFEPALGR
jgi:hypothetical protein